MTYSAAWLWQLPAEKQSWWLTIASRPGRLVVYFPLLTGEILRLSNFVYPGKIIIHFLSRPQFLNLQNRDNTSPILWHFCSFSLPASSAMNEGTGQSQWHSFFFLTVQGLCCFAQAFSSWESRGYSSLWCSGLVALQHVKSSWIRDQTHTPLHWQVDSYPLYHQESPPVAFWIAGPVWFSTGERIKP